MLSRHLRNNSIGLSVGVALALLALPALAQDRCEGTLCDLYYGNSPPPSKTTTQPPAAGKPLMVPSGGTLFGNLFGGSSSQAQQPTQQQPATGGAPARKPVVAVQGGGLLGMMHGDPQDRCEGTLCDLYYGGPKPERPEPSAQPAATGADPSTELAPQTEEPARVIERREDRQCADTRDPWACYRR